MNNKTLLIEPSFSRSHKKNIQPIIIVGMNRSGTKWLSNILCNHPEIYGVQTELDDGIVETNLFGIIQNKFDITQPDDYVGFIELWSASNFFKQTKLNKEIFYQLSPRPTDFFDIFKFVMETCAIRENKKYWLQKTSPILAENVLEYFNNAHVLLIKREPIHTIKSTLKIFIERRNGKKSLYLFLRQIYIYILDEKRIHNIEKQKKAILISYENLKKNSENEIKKICDKIGLQFEKDMLNITYKKNTSFKNKDDRNQIFTKTDEKIIRVLTTLLRMIPFPLMKFMKDLGYKKHLLTKGDKSPLVPGTFSNIKVKYNIK